MESLDVLIDAKVGEGGSDSEEWDDPGDTLTVPEADTSTVKMLQARTPSQSPSPTRRDETDSDTTNNKLEEDEDLHQQWNASLYMLQTKAPIAKCVYTNKEVEDCPPHCGKEYHGHLSRNDTRSLLGTVDGTYLVRVNVTDVTVLSFRMNSRVYNYRLYFDQGLHYLGDGQCDNRFEVLHDLVQDCLIVLYLQQHDVAKTMKEGQVQTITRKKRFEKKLKLLKRTCGKRVKGLKGKKAWDYQRTISDASLTSVNSPSPTPSPVNSPSASPNLSPRFLSDNEQQASKARPSTRPKSASDAHFSSVCTEESNLDFRPSDIRRSTPNLPTPTESGFVQHCGLPGITKRRTSSISSLPVIKTTSDGTSKYSNIISILRDAVNEDKRKEHLKLDNVPVVRLKTSRSDGKVGKDKNCGNADSLQPRTLSCNIPFAVSLAEKGAAALSRSSLTALARHSSGPKSPYYKAHQFSVHSYTGPTWCEVCHHFLWGLKHQGMRCKDCGMDIHKQCVQLTLQMECYPNKQCVKKVYGADLTTLVKLEGGVIPQVLSDLFGVIQSRDLSTEGIYRVSGQTSEVLDIKEKYNEGETVDYAQILDLNVLTGAVKLYLRELPLPLITFDVYAEIMKATAAVTDVEDHNFDWQPFRDSLKLLPKAHYATLQHFTQHLHQVHTRSSENKMTALNLSVVLAPTLMRPPDDSGSLFADLPLQRNFVEYIILKHDTIFR